MIAYYILYKSLERIKSLLISAGRINVNKLLTQKRNSLTSVNQTTNDRRDELVFRKYDNGNG